MCQIPDQTASPKTTLELKAIRARLDEILNKRHLLSHERTSDCENISRMAIINSPIVPLTLSAKDEHDQDQEKVIVLLLSVKLSELQAGPCIVPIDRKDGGGTTELTRAIVKDKRVLDHFGKRIWVNAPEIVDAAKLFKLISKRASTVFWVHKTLDNNMEEQLLLLVLDDIIRDNNKRPYIVTDEIRIRGVVFKRQMKYCLITRLLFWVHKTLE